MDAALNKKSRSQLLLHLSLHEQDAGFSQAYLSISVSACPPWLYHPPCLSLSVYVSLCAMLCLPLPSRLLWGLCLGPGCGTNFLIPACTSNQNFQLLLDKEPHFEAKSGWGLLEPEVASSSSFTSLTSTPVAFGPCQALV